MADLHAALASNIPHAWQSEGCCKDQSRVLSPRRPRPPSSPASVQFLTGLGSWRLDDSLSSCGDLLRLHHPGQLAACQPPTCSRPTRSDVSAAAFPVGHGQYFSPCDATQNPGAMSLAPRGLFWPSHPRRRPFPSCPTPYPLSESYDTMRLLTCLESLSATLNGSFRKAGLLSTSFKPPALAPSTVPGAEQTFSNIS